MADRIATSTLQRNAVNAILDQQRRLATLQDQLARGIRLTRAADDPAAMGESLRLDDALAGLERDRSNINTLRSRLGIEEATLEQFSGTLQRVRELVLQGANATQSAESRGQIAKEVQARLEELFALANAQDGGGRYLFGGTRDGQTPFSLGSGGVSYAGDDSVRSMEIGSGRSVRSADAGSDVFLRIPSGNGTFRLAAGSNDGTAKVLRASLIDPALYDGGSYTLSFSAGTYAVTDGGGAVVAGGAYTAGQPVAFAGIQLELGGLPADGDTFTVSPSRSQSVFESVARIVSALGDPADAPAADAQRHVALQTGLDELDQALGHISAVRADVGARLSVLDQAEDQLGGVGLVLNETLSALRDLDYAEASSRLALQLTGLEAAQQSFLRIQGLSLFQLIR